MASTSRRVGPAAAAAQVLDLEGRPRPLAALWGEHPVVLVFLRHFG